MIQTPVRLAEDRGPAEDRPLASLVPHVVRAGGALDVVADLDHDMLRRTPSDRDIFGGSDERRARASRHTPAASSAADVATGAGRAGRTDRLRRRRGPRSGSRTVCGLPSVPLPVRAIRIRCARSAVEAAAGPAGAAPRARRRCRPRSTCAGRGERTRRREGDLRRRGLGRRARRRSRWRRVGEGVGSSPGPTPPGSRLMPTTAATTTAAIAVASLATEFMSAILRAGHHGPALWGRVQQGEDVVEDAVR